MLARTIAARVFILARAHNNWNRELKMRYVNRLSLLKTIVRDTVNTFSDVEKHTFLEELSKSQRICIE